MANNEIRQKIILEGEREYKEALKEANRNLKTLRSELKAETAELGKNATEQQKTEIRVKSLQKQIQEQEKIVKTYTAALNEVREKYADNEDEIAKWEIKLNDARTALANMKNGLGDVGQGFQQATADANTGVTAAQSFAEAFRSLSDIGDNISGAIEEIFKGTVDMVRDVISDVWGQVVDLAARSNNLVDLAGFWNTDVTTIQKYKGAVAEVSASLEDLNTIVTKINSKDSKKIAELTGVSNANYKDQWEYAMAVMDAMSKMSTEARNNAGFEIFGGRQATKAFDLLNDWSTVLANLDKYDAENGGYGLTKEELQSMSELYDKVNGLKQSWSELKDMATVKLFGQLSLDVTGNAQSILDAFLEYFNADSDDERNTAIEKLETNIKEMFETIAQAIRDGIKILKDVSEDLKASKDPIVQGIGNILGGIADALQWFTADNAQNFKTALMIIAGVWGSAEVLKMVSVIGELAGHVRTIKLYRGLNGVLKAIGGGSGTGTAAAGAGAAAEGAGIASGAGSALPLMMQNAAIIGAAITPALIAQSADERRVEERRQARVDAAEHLDGTEKEFLLQAADALGLKRDENGNIERNVFGQGWIGGNEAEIERLLMGLGDRSDLQKSQLHNLLNGSFTSAGYDTWSELMRLWSGEGMDMGRMTAMLDAITEAYTRIPETPADWWKGGTNEDGVTSQDIQSLNKMPEAVKGAVAALIGSIRINLDGQKVADILTPQVSERVARDLED